MAGPRTGIVLGQFVSIFCLSHFDLNIFRGCWTIWSVVSLSIRLASRVMASAVRKVSTRDKEWAGFEHSVVATAFLEWKDNMPASSLYLIVYGILSFFQQLSQLQTQLSFYISSQNQSGLINQSGLRLTYLSICNGSWDKICFFSPDV